MTPIKSYDRSVILGSLSKIQEAKGMLEQERRRLNFGLEDAIQYQEKPTQIAYERAMALIDEVISELEDRHVAIQNMRYEFYPKRT